MDIPDEARDFFGMILSSTPPTKETPKEELKNNTTNNDAILKRLDKIINILEEARK